MESSYGGCLVKEVIAYTDGSAIKQIKDSSKYHGGAGVVLIYNGKEITS